MHLIPNYDEVYLRPPEEKKDKRVEYGVDVIINISVLAHDEEEAKEIAKSIVSRECPDYFNFIDISSVEKCTS